MAGVGHYAGDIRLALGGHREQLAPRLFVHDIAGQTAALLHPSAHFPEQFVLLHVRRLAQLVIGRRI